MSSSKNSDFNFTTELFEQIVLDQTFVDKSLKPRIFKFTDILNFEKTFSLQYFYKYNNLFCILKNIKNLLEKIEININQNTLDLDNLFLNYNHEIIKLESIVNKDDRINEIIYYISTIIEFIKFYKLNLVLDKYFINLKCLMIEIIKLLKNLLEKIMPIQLGNYFIHSSECQPIINIIVNKLFELKNISKFWTYIISQIPKKTQKVIIFDYENLKRLSSNYVNINPQINIIYNQVNVINKLCASINSNIENNSGILLWNSFSKMVEKSEYLQDNGQEKFSDITNLEFHPHSTNCFINHKGNIIKPEEVTLIFIYKGIMEDINMLPLLILQKYNYNILLIKVSAIISSDGVMLDMKNGANRQIIDSKIQLNSLLKYLKEFDDSFCIFLLCTLKKNTDFSVFLLSTDNYLDISEKFNDINDSFKNTMPNYIDKIIIKDINNVSINFNYDISLMNNVGIDVKKIRIMKSVRQIYRNQGFNNDKTNFNIFYKKYLKYKQKYLKLKNN